MRLSTILPLILMAATAFNAIHCADSARCHFKQSLIDPITKAPEKLASIFAEAEKAWGRDVTKTTVLQFLNLIHHDCGCEDATFAKAAILELLYYSGKRVAPLITPDDLKFFAEKIRSAGQAAHVEAWLKHYEKLYADAKNLKDLLQTASQPLLFTRGRSTRKKR